MEQVVGYNTKTDTLFFVQHVGEEVVAILSEDQGHMIYMIVTMEVN